jgi:CheY-like chemotaxis protein/HPt (histidine-containing phosphotransfer) domain-containing protein
MTDSNAATGRLANIRMLIVDDNDVNRLVLKGMAEHEGALVVSCENGREAVAALEQAGSKAFDVVITDIQMPVMDGYETTRRVLALAPGLPVLGLSAHVAPEDVGGCLNVGMRECLIKPLEMPVLIAAVLRHVARPGPAADGVPTTTRETSAAALGEAGALVNWAQLEARYGGKPALFERLLAIPGQKYADRPARLRAAAQAGNIEALRELAHATKGMAGELFAEPLRAIALETEMLAREGRQEACVRAEALADVFAAFLDEIDRDRTTKCRR